MKRARLPAALVAFASSCTPNPDAQCVPEQIDAGTGVRTYHCKDGRACGTPDPSAIDGGTYQICPGTNECELVVSYDGTTRVDFC
jgi:hypothetical protein